MLTKRFETWRYVEAIVQLFHLLTCLITSGITDFKELLGTASLMLKLTIKQQ